MDTWGGSWGTSWGTSWSPGATPDNPALLWGAHAGARKRRRKQRDEQDMKDLAKMLGALVKGVDDVG